jgi:hypothetical protein
MFKKRMVNTEAVREGNCSEAFNQSPNALDKWGPADRFTVQCRASFLCRYGDPYIL